MFNVVLVLFILISILVIQINTYKIGLLKEEIKELKLKNDELERKIK